MSIEEYIAKRKREDKINEFDIEARLENMQICVNYIFEYFNQYLDINKMNEQTILQEERLLKFKNQLEMYDKDIQDWLVNIYDNYDKHIHRSIISFLKKEPLFLLYHTDEEFRSCSYDCYAQLIKKNPFLKDQTEMLFRFIRDYHRIQSEKEINKPSVFISDDINDWLENTWNKYKVNIWAFATDYASRFFDNDSLWPTKHKIKSNEEWKPYFYDYKQKTNLFNLNSLYTKISKKPFMRGKKQQLEIILMYIWLHEIWGDEDNYWEEYYKKTVSRVNFIILTP